MIILLVLFGIKEIGKVPLNSKIGFIPRLVMGLLDVGSPAVGDVGGLRVEGDQGQEFRLVLALS